MEQLVHRFVKQRHFVGVVAGEEIDGRRLGHGRRPVDVDAQRNVDVLRGRSERRHVLAPVAEVNHVVLRKLDISRVAFQQAGQLAFGGVEADEQLLPNAVEPFEPLAQSHGFLDPAIGQNVVMLGGDDPARGDIRMKLSVLLGRDPASLVVTLALLVLVNLMRFNQPNRSCQT